MESHSSLNSVQGHCEGLPSTSNALESQHKHIKTHPLLKQARSLGPFLEIIKDVIKKGPLIIKRITLIYLTIQSM